MNLLLFTLPSSKPVTATRRALLTSNISNDTIGGSHTATASVFSNGTNDTSSNNKNSKTGRPSISSPAILETPTTTTTAVPTADGIAVNSVPSENWWSLRKARLEETVTKTAVAATAPASKSSLTTSRSTASSAVSTSSLAAGSYDIHDKENSTEFGVQDMIVISQFKVTAAVAATATATAAATAVSTRASVWNTTSQRSSETTVPPVADAPSVTLSSLLSTCSLPLPLPLSRPILRSCLKRQDASPRTVGNRPKKVVTFKRRGGMVQIHLFKDAGSDYNDETDHCDADIGSSSMVATAGTRTIVDTNDTITSMALLRDKTLLQTDTVAWNYTWAYDAAYLQFYEHEAQVAASEKGNQVCKSGHGVRPRTTAKHQAVDSALQRTLIHGILLDYGTLERFSGDSAIRRKQACETRRFILQMYQALKENNSGNCPVERLATYCQAINRMPEQWAVFMGNIQAAAVAAEAALCMDDDDAVVPARALPSLPSSRLPLPAWAEAAEKNVLDSGHPQRTKYSFRCWHERRRMLYAKPICITLTA